MKKVISVLSALLLALSLCACGETKENEYYLGLGVVAEGDFDTANRAALDVTVAAVVTDKNGKIVNCKIDAAECAVDIENGTLDKGKSFFESKGQQKEDYGMRSASGIGKEWYEQADFFADYVVGMTSAQVSEIKTVITADGGETPDESILLAGCTVDISDFTKAVIKGCEKENLKNFALDEWSLGVGVDAVLSDESADATSEKNGTAVFDVTLAASVEQDNGKIKAAALDAVSAEIKFDSSGTPTETVREYKTKRTLGDSYGMKEYSGIGREWYEQAEAFEDYVVGLDKAGVSGIITSDVNGSLRAAEEYLSAGCTVAIDGFIRAVVKSLE